jgi:HPt (histidine-containing phosphotransfer) domain-containing protein
MMGSSLEGVMINGIPLKKQINFLDEIMVEEFDHFTSDQLEHFEAIKQTLEAEQKRRATNVLLNGGKRG